MKPTISANSPSPVVQQSHVAEQPNAYLFTPLSQPEPLAATPEIMRYPITVGHSVKRPSDITTRDIACVMDAIRTGFNEGYNLKKAIEVIRNMQDKEAQRNAKITLPWFCGSLMHKKRANANVKQASFMIFDLDHVGVAMSPLPQPIGRLASPALASPAAQAQAIEELKALAMAKLPWLRYAFRSAVDGVKLIAQFTQPITSEEVYRRVYIFLALQIEWALKHICDTTPDWARACFMSYDPNLLSKHNCMPLDPLVTYKQATSVMDIAMPKDGVANSCLPQRTKEASSSGSARSVNREIDRPTDYAKAEYIVSIMSTIPIVYKDWIKLGQALYAGFGEQGKALWDMFLNNPNYRDSQRTLDAHWRSFRKVQSIKLASLFYVAEQYGVKYV